MTQEESRPRRLKHLRPAASLSQWLSFIAGVVFCIGVVGVAWGHLPVRATWVKLAALLMVTLSYRSLPVFVELWMVFWLGGVVVGGGPAGYATLIPAVLLFTGYGPSRLMRALAVMGGMVGAVLTAAPAAPGFGLAAWVAMSCVALTLAIAAVELATFPVPPPRSIDVVVNSASGNTMHYTREFIAGLESAGARTTIYRFHYYRDFRAELAGDALVVAFPVYGGKPPWPMLAWLLRRLPRGRRRPAFVLYSCAGVPENASLLLWLILRVKGWRVCGRSWGLYPVNIATFRLGPRPLWRFLDRLVPRPADLTNVRAHGAAFARGVPAGFPLVVWPFFLFVLGILLDNKWLDTPLYRNYAWRRRCNGCQICVAFCPAERLRLVDGRPRPRGTCTLCLGCINVCPQRAMELRCWSEYGQPYSPRWPELVVRHKSADGRAVCSGAAGPPA